MMKIRLLDFELPEELIAQEPVEPRDSSRLMIVDRSTNNISHARFRELCHFLRKDDLLVFNNTRVIPAKIEGVLDTGGKVEILLLKEKDFNLWECLVRPARKFTYGRKLFLGEGSIRVTVEGYIGKGLRTLRFETDKNLKEKIREVGRIPLPPYIKKELKSPERYQTIYSKVEGSSAAPTAGLHFTDRLMEEIRTSGIETAFITLHVGIDTFKPIEGLDCDKHKMHSEEYEITKNSARKINNSLEKGKRIVAVGTTVVRALESSFVDGKVIAGKASTQLFIKPGFKFNVVGAMITNFHLPKTTLILLVSTFAGEELIFKAYKTAVKEKYRFYSFGDAMLIL